MSDLGDFQNVPFLFGSDEWPEDGPGLHINPFIHDEMDRLNSDLHVSQEPWFKVPVAETNMVYMGPFVSERQHKYGHLKIMIT